MKTGTDTATSAQAGANPLFRRIICGALARMPYGTLTVRMPDGEVLSYGRGVNPSGHTVKAAVVIHDADFFRRCVVFGHIGFAEAYMDGHWETDDIASVIAWFLLNLNDCRLLEGTGKKPVFVNFMGFINQCLHIFKHNSQSNSKKNISYHYDLSNELFKLFLDETMTYSSAFFKDAQAGLKEAQIAKYDAICRKLDIKATDHILEIGSGWGGFALHAVQNHGCRHTGVTISKEQLDYATELVKAAGLSDKIEFRLLDYRKLDGSKERFDKIVSIEMIEAVGHEYLDAFFNKCDEMLKPDGLLAMQMITCPDSRYDLIRQNTDFIQKHIFPGSLLPSLRQVSQSMQKTELFLHDLEDLGNDYARTLVTWQERFEGRLQEVYALGFDAVFVRKWRYYLSYCAAAFAMRNITVVQAVYTRPNNLSLSHGLLPRFAADKALLDRGAIEPSVHSKTTQDKVNARS
ncbi:MAG: class I SAM-dependent methyltransferase [Candidatus Obscuribacter sp.]|nr:class I SAM-dependent methyltransferase [Candidatus Obscuribacter sp.]